MMVTKSIALALLFAALVAAAPSAQARGKDSPPQPPECIPSQIGAVDRSPDALLTSRSRVPMWAREAMETRVDEIAERIYRLSTFLPRAGQSGFTFNQFLVDAEEPLLFHCGQRALFPAVSRAAARITDLRRLRWIAFSHIEADECGALDEWLDAAPDATVTHGAIGCAIWLNDQAPRPPRALADGEVLDLGGRRVRRLDTPHVPHCWDAGLLYEETTATLFTSDLFTHVGNPPALTHGDIIGPAVAAEKHFGFTAVTPATGATIRRLATLQPRTLAVMHGSSFSGDAVPALESLAGFYDDLLHQGMARGRA